MTGVVAREGLVDGSGVVVLDTSPIANFARSLSSRVVLCPAFLPAPCSGVVELLPCAGLLGCCEASDFFKLDNAESDIWAEDCVIGRTESVDARSAVPDASGDGLVIGCAKVSTACRHCENMRYVET